MISIVNTECHVPKTFSDLAKIAAWGRLGQDRATKSRLRSIASSIASAGKRSRIDRVNVPTPGPYSTNSRVLRQSTWSSIRSTSVADEGMTDPIMPGCLTNWRKNMPHWLKNDPVLPAPALFLFFFNGMEAINTRLYGYCTSPCKSRPRWQAALQHECHERGGGGWVQSAAARSVGPTGSVGPVA